MFQKKRTEEEYLRSRKEKRKISLKKFDRILQIETDRMISSVVTSTLLWSDLFSSRFRKLWSIVWIFTNKKSRTFAVDMIYFLSFGLIFLQRLIISIFKKLDMTVLVCQKTRRKRSYFWSLVSFYNIFFSIEYLISKRFLPIQFSESIELMNGLFGLR